MLAGFLIGIGQAVARAWLVEPRLRLVRLHQVEALCALGNIEVLLARGDFGFNRVARENRRLALRRLGLVLGSWLRTLLERTDPDQMRAPGSPSFERPSTESSVRLLNPDVDRSVKLALSMKDEYSRFLQGLLDED